MWESYGPLFHLEENRIFPPELDELGFYRDIRREYPGNCADIGAGDGRIARELLSDDLTVAVEPSAAMIHLWERSVRDSVSLVQALAEPLPLRSGTLDLVLYPYNLVHCLRGRAERLRMFEETARILKPGARLILEACPAFGTRGDEKETERYSHEVDGVSLTLREAVQVDRKAGTIIFHMHYTGGSVPGGSSRIDLVLALLDTSAILRELKLSGFGICTVWGDYDRSPWCGGSSPRLLVLAERIPG